MANIIPFEFFSVRHTNTDQSVSNVERDWVRYGYQMKEPVNPMMGSHTFRPEVTPSVNSGGNAISVEDFNVMFPTGTTEDNATGKLVGIYIEKQGTTGVIPEERHHGSGKVLDQTSQNRIDHYPYPLTRSGCKIVFEVQGTVKYDNHAGWETLIFEHTGILLHREDARKSQHFGFNTTDAVTRWTWENVHFDDYFFVFSKNVSEENFINNVFIQASLIDEKITVPFTRNLFKDLTHGPTRKDKTIFQGPPLLVNNLHENVLPLGFDIKGTRLFGNKQSDSHIMAPNFINLGPRIESKNNCTIYGSGGSVIAASDTQVTVLEHIIGSTVPTDLNAWASNLTGRKIRNRDGTFRATITNAQYQVGGKSGKLFDADLNGVVDALTDGLMFLRYMFNVRAHNGLATGAIAEDAERDTAEEVEEYIQQLVSASALDIDGDGSTDALTDGLMILRYAFNVRLASGLTTGAIAGGATRTGEEIEAYLNDAFNEHVALSAQNDLLTGPDGRPITAASNTAANTQSVLTFTLDSSSLRSSPATQDELYIEMEEAEELNNIRVSGAEYTKNGAVFNFEEWHDGLESYVEHITSQDTTRPNSWIYSEFYGKPMLLLEPVAAGAYTLETSVQTVKDPRLSRKITANLTSWENDVLKFDADPGIRMLDRVLIVNNGSAEAKVGIFQVSFIASQDIDAPLPIIDVISITDFNNPEGIGSYSGSLDDIELFHIGGDTGIAQDERTSIQVQGYAGPTQEVTLTNLHEDDTISERISAKIDMLPVGEIVLVKHNEITQMPPLTERTTINILEKDDEFINGNCTVKNIGGKQQLITPIGGGSRYRALTKYSYRESADVYNEKIFQVEGVVRGIPLEIVREFPDAFSQLANLVSDTVFPDPLVGTDGIRLTIKLNTTFTSTEQIEALRGQLVNIHVVNFSGGSMASTAGPLKILEGNADDSNFTPSFLVMDSCVFVPDGTSTNWSANLRLELRDVNDQLYMFQTQFTGTYKPEFGFDILGETGESRLNTNSKPLRYASAGSGEKVPNLITDEDGELIIPIGTDGENAFDPNLEDPDAEEITISSILGYPDDVPKTVVNSEGETVEGFPLSSVLVARINETSRNFDFSARRTITVTYYHKGRVIHEQEVYTSPRSFPTSSALAYVFTEEGASLQRSRSSASTYFTDDKKVLLQQYAYNTHYSFVQPITYATDTYLEANDNLSGNEDSLVVINNEPESMVGIELDVPNNRYKIVPTDWPNSFNPTHFWTNTSQTQNFGRQDWHLGHKYAFQVLRIK